MHDDHHMVETYMVHRGKHLMIGTEYIESLTKFNVAALPPNPRKLFSCAQSLTCCGIFGREMCRQLPSPSHEFRLEIHEPASEGFYSISFFINI
jgi:hypothetical protein